MDMNPSLAQGQSGVFNGTEDPGRSIWQQPWLHISDASLHLEFTEGNVQDWAMKPFPKM